MSTFHVFPRLPPEIRVAIYILATPPRVVYLRQELESFEDFQQRLASIPIAEWLRPDLDLSSICESLRQTAATLRHQSRTTFKQTKLEAYGFASKKKAPFSWEFEHLLPFDVLPRVPTLAFTLYRRATILSQAAIPPLLHTCCESRSFLVGYGYQLAFPSKDQHPRTWFNFTQDTLLLHEGMDVEDEACAIQYSLHHFRPQDIARIRRLALTYSTHTNRVFLAHKLCQELEELILVEWVTSESYQALRRSIVNPNLLRRAPNIPRNYYTGEKFCMLPVEEVDALWTTLGLELFGIKDEWNPDVTEASEYLKQHKIKNGFLSLFLDHKVHQMRDVYEAESEYIENYSKYHSRKRPPELEDFPPWNNCQMQFMHICTPYIADRILENRSRFLEQFAKLRAEAAHEEDKNDGSWNEPPRLPYPFVFQRSKNWPAADESSHSIMLQWWIKNGFPAVRS